jgi:mannose-6-phosphate isomerase-like protein (cupin superfamily)
MDFKSRGIPFHYLSNEEAKDTSFITDNEIQEILSSEYLHDQGSFYIVEKDGTYRDQEKFLFGTGAFKMKEIESAYLNGHTILVKNLENWNIKIQKKCLELGSSTNVHMYISPKGGSAFDWHSDDRDVYIFLQIGRKNFEVKDANGSCQSFQLKLGAGLFIPYGVFHRGQAQESHSVHLSFGVWPEDLTIREEYPLINIPIKIL